MKSVKINECIFNKILVALKGNLSKDWQRPTLKFIRLDVKKDKIIGYSVDGYTAGRIIIPCVKPNTDEFTAYIKPIPFKETTRGNEEVVISVDNGLASVEIMQEEKQCYTFKMPESFGLNIEQIWKEEDYADEEISVNALWLAKSLKTLSATHYDPQHRAVIKIKKNKTKPIIARTMCEDIQIDQLILPIRNMKEVNVEEKVNEMKNYSKLKKLYKAVESYYYDLDSLTKRLQLDYAGDKEFEQMEEDRLALIGILDTFDELKEEIFDRSVK